MSPFWFGMIATVPNPVVVAIFQKVGVWWGQTSIDKDRKEIWLITCAFEFESERLFDFAVAGQLVVCNIITK